ncbi:MAG: TIGR03862 family flavoprotein [Bacteroidales bacterium]|nr:TIGR03862 family flavoprotein [Bacteroidales bacterium]
MRKTIMIYGAGAAGLLAAMKLCRDHEVIVVDKERNIGQKLLIAGKGGLNITNHAEIQDLLPKYIPEGFLDESLRENDTLAFRSWLEQNGIPTYTGSSGKVFPEKGNNSKSILQNFKKKLQAAGVEFRMKSRFAGFNTELKPQIETKGVDESAEADYHIFALGGASWPQTGSDGSWLEQFRNAGFAILPLEASNCGVNIQWPESISRFHTGKPLKNISISFKDKSSKGEAVLTETGLEGYALYPLIPLIREGLNKNETVIIELDLKPNSSVEQLKLKLSGKNIKPQKYAEALNLNPLQMALAKALTSKETYLNSLEFAAAIKKLPLKIESLRPIEEAISSVGGLAVTELNSDFSLVRNPNLFAIGEMTNWDAPTGGFLLQACYSMACRVSRAIEERNQ